jgi:hypothetical protein
MFGRPLLNCGTNWYSSNALGLYLVGTYFECGPDEVFSFDETAEK